MPRYETYSQVKKVYNISPETVRNWARRGAVRYKCVQNATRKTWLYDMESIGEYLQRDTEQAERAAEEAGPQPVRVIYIRVSSAKQAADLERQRELLTAAFPDAEIVQDIGSGLNFKREGFTRLVRRICRDEITQVVVTFKDRLARFGFELFKLLCTEHGCSVLVYGDGIENADADEEAETDLKDDLFAIINVLVASHNGRRAATLKRERKRLKEAAERDIKDEALPDATAEEKAEPDDGRE